MTLIRCCESAWRRHVPATIRLVCDRIVLVVDSTGRQGHAGVTYGSRGGHGVVTAGSWPGRGSRFGVGAVRRAMGGRGRPGPTHPEVRHACRRAGHEYAGPCRGGEPGMMTGLTSLLTRARGLYNPVRSDYAGPLPQADR